MLISREYAKTVLSTLAQKLSGVYKRPNAGIPESDLADDVREKLGGGLPDASEIENGTAMIAVDGEWVKQEGYGYEEPAFDPITWDGDTEGRTYIDAGGALYVKVSDQVLTLDQIIGATLHFNNNNLAQDETITEDAIVSSGGLLSAGYVFTAEAGTYEADGVSITVPESGTYFMYQHDEVEGEEVELYLSSLTASSVIHPIDKSLIPDTDANKVTLADATGHFDSDTVEGALAEIGAELAGINTLIRSGVVLREYDLKFYNGSTLLSTVSVPYGTDGSYTGSAPTKAQTAQYTYSFSGWSLTSGGAADPDALVNVTADRSVYAAFSATVRTYTVTFVNNTSGSNVTLQIVSKVAYGSTAAYTGSTPVSAVDASLAFLGWEPTPTNITGNTTCYAQFENPFEDAEITDSWDTIIENIESGAYKTAYKVGQYKPLDLGTEGVINMQIAAFDTDDKADGSGKAGITWIAKELLATGHKMNATGTNSGGWEATEMRSYLKNTIKPLIPSNVRNAIVNVTKKSDLYPSSSQTTTEDVWIPSYKEAFDSGEGDYYYSALFPDNASRIKHKAGSTSANFWWLRSASTSGFSYFRRVSPDGNVYDASADYADGVALSFCT